MKWLVFVLNEAHGPIEQAATDKPANTYNKKAEWMPKNDLDG